MKKATITSVCECQARLSAELDENRQVIAGFATDLRRRKTSIAPAHSIVGQHEIFDVAWFCPLCVRNTLRSFSAGGLHWRETGSSTGAAVT
jgi:hypothetical protein